MSKSDQSKPTLTRESLSLKSVEKRRLNRVSVTDDEGEDETALVMDATDGEADE